MHRRAKFALVLAAIAPFLLGSATSPVQQRVLQAANEILEWYDASYAYGGHRLGTPEQCHSCNECLTGSGPAPRRQLQVCPGCQACSLDCSHFTNLVFRRAGLSQPYLQTALMIDLSASALFSRYQLVDLQTRLNLAQPGDLLVYRGHVVLLESRTGTQGNIIHATAGRELRGPGHGIQRERDVPLASYRGPLLRILRHRDLHEQSVGQRLRPIAKGD